MTAQLKTAPKLTMKYFAMYDGVLHYIGEFASRDEAHDEINPTDPDWSFTLDEHEAEEWIFSLVLLLSVPRSEGLEKYAVLKDRQFHPIGEFRSQESAEEHARKYALNDDWSYMANTPEMNDWLTVLLNNTQS